MQFRYTLVLLTMLTARLSFAQNNSLHLDDLKFGMSEYQIKQIIGEPTHIESFATVKYNSSDTSIYWKYTNEVIIVVTNHQFDRIEKNKDVLLKYIQQKSGKKEADGLIVISHGKK